MKNVLLVDDDLMTRKLIGLALKGTANLFEAKDTDEADNILRDGKIALIILDIIMPGKDGLIYAGELKINPATKKIPIIFLTEAPSELKYYDPAIDIGAIYYFRKSDIMQNGLLAEYIGEFLK